MTQVVSSGYLTGVTDWCKDKEVGTNPGQNAAKISEGAGNEVQLRTRHLVANKTDCIQTLERSSLQN